MEKLNTKPVKFPCGVVINDSIIHKNFIRNLNTIMTPIEIALLGGVNQVNYIELTYGNIGGNHYHKIKNEFFYLAQGDLGLFFIDRKTRQKYQFQLEKDIKFFVPIKVPHAIVSLDKEKTSTLIEFSNFAYNPKIQDTFSFEVLNNRSLEKILSNSK